MRSRFWLASEVEAMSGGLGLVAFITDNKFIKKIAHPSNAPKELAFHGATEYSQLSSFFSELYEL